MHTLCSNAPAPVGVLTGCCCCWLRMVRCWWCARHLPGQCTSRSRSKHVSFVGLLIVLDVQHLHATHLAHTCTQDVMKSSRLHGRVCAWVLIGGVPAPNRVSAPHDIPTIRQRDCLQSVIHSVSQTACRMTTLPLLYAQLWQNL